MSKKRVIIVLCIILFVCILAVCIYLGTPIKDFGTYKDNPGNFVNDKSVEEINKEYSQALESMESDVDSINWSYVNTDWNPDLDKLESDEYAYIYKYVSDLGLTEYQHEQMKSIDADGYSMFAFETDGVEYTVLYSVECNEIYVYARIIE